MQVGRRSDRRHRQGRRSDQIRITSYLPEPERTYPPSLRRQRQRRVCPPVPVHIPPAVAGRVRARQAPPRGVPGWVGPRTRTRRHRRACVPCGAPCSGTGRARAGVRHGATTCRRLSLRNRVRSISPCLPLSSAAAAPPLLSHRAGGGRWVVLVQAVQQPAALTRVSSSRSWSTTLGPGLPRAVLDSASLAPSLRIVLHRSTTPTSSCKTFVCK